MTGHEIFTAFGNIDRKFILEAAPEQRRRGILSPAVRRSLIAACLCLILCGSVITGLLTSGYVPTVNGAMFSAEEIEQILQQDAMEGVTNAYIKIKVKSADELVIHPIPDTEYLPIYETKLAKLDLDELYEYSMRIADRLGQALGREFTLHQITDEYELPDDDCRAILISGDDIDLRITQRMDYYEISFSHSGRRSQYTPLTLNGEPLIIDNSLSNAEIETASSGIIRSLVNVFELDLPNIIVEDSYGGKYIRLYSGDHHFTEDYTSHPRYREYYAFDDHMTIHFNDSSYNASIHVYITKFRKDMNELCPEIAHAKMLTLEEAEELLCKGYVFGGHSCDICMSEQDKVDFEGYDYVGLQYVFGKGKYYYDTIAVPFYVFYKLIETQELETHTVYTYAKTYVPAVKVRRLDKYFKMQQEKHPASE